MTWGLRSFRVSSVEVSESGIVITSDTCKAQLRRDPLSVAER